MNEKLHLFGEYVLDTARGCLLRGGQPVHLRPQAYKVLQFLIENRGRLISKDQLIEEVWEGRAVTDDSLVQCLRDVRQALGEGGAQYLRTERGRGYIFDPPNGAWSEQVDVVRVIVEEEEVVEGEFAAPPRLPAVATAALPGAARVSRRALVAACLVGVGLIAIAAYYFSRPESGRPTNTAGVRSLAVLPFKPLVAEGRDEALELGMADTLIAKLSNIAEVTVRPLNAVRRYGGLEQDPVDAGRQLGVEAVLDGTVQRSGEGVRVTARLVRVGDGRQLWEGRFDAPFTGIFSVQDAISEKVAASLKPRLTSTDEQKLAKRYTDNVEAYQLYLQGRHHALKRTLPETQEAISYFQQAIDLDSSYALAYAGLADAHISSLAADLPPNEFLPQARAAALRAIEIDDTLAEAHAELGFIIFWWDWDWGASERELKRALDLDPNSANAHLFYAHLLSNTGRHVEALAEAKRARELDPLNLRNNALEAQFLIHAGRTDEALSRLRETLEMDPNYFLARLYAASAYIEKGMYAEAISEARRAREISGARSNYLEAFLGYALTKSGKEVEAGSVLDGLLKSSAERYVSPYAIALVYNGLGEHDKAFASLERAYAQRSPGMVFLKVEPKWNNLRSDARFQDLLRRLRLTP
ncbi:MAG: winged helix-turn-helix domain-containing protein [Acidobacteriota bacterium]|nr:winged helix-turn-helix domain-containing protein [Acidobacteriota bacterium]